MDFSYENEAYDRGFVCVCGTDEAGRGPLAGAVYAGAVVLPRGYVHPILNDSKKLSEKKRELVYDDIVRDAVAWAVGIADEKEIDEINILNASMLAMRRAVDALMIKPDFLYVDGNSCPGTGMSEAAIVKGDSKCMSVAAASVIAKVSRDRYMEELAALYPQYQFEKHKGYPTALHYELIREYGVSPVHRVTFLKNFNEKHNG